MRTRHDISDNEIRIIGSQPSKRKYYIIAVALAIVAIAVSIFIYFANSTNDVPQKSEKVIKSQLSEVVPTDTQAFVELRDTIANDIPLKISIPHNARMELHIGEMNPKDTAVIYTAMAADIRADNGGIVGAFVLKGELKAQGLSKRGYCAVIDGAVTIGVAESSPLFEEAIEQGGYFFRQYPLVDNGKLVENRLKAQSVRRAICDRQGEIFIAETLTRATLHDFAQALVELGIDNAIYLVGGESYGWAVDKAGTHHHFGNPEALPIGYTSKPVNRNFIVWRGV